MNPLMSASEEGDTVKKQMSLNNKDNMSERKPKETFDDDDLLQPGYLAYWPYLKQYV